MENGICIFPWALDWQRILCIVVFKKVHAVG